jgi:hypothetical protein
LLPEIRRLLALVVFVIVNVPAVEAGSGTNEPLVKVIVQMPPAVQFGSLAGIAKVIVSGSIVAFADAIAARKLPAPVSAVVVTVKVAALADAVKIKSTTATKAVTRPMICENKRIFE